MTKFAVMLDVAIQFSPSANLVAYFVAFVAAEIAWIENFPTIFLLRGASPRFHVAVDPFPNSSANSSTRYASLMQCMSDMPSRINS